MGRDCQLFWEGKTPPLLEIGGITVLNLFVGDVEGIWLGGYLCWEDHKDGRVEHSLSGSVGRLCLVRLPDTELVDGLDDLHAVLDELCNRRISSSRCKFIQVRLVHGYGVLTLRTAVSLLVVVLLWEFKGHSVGDLENCCRGFQL